MVQNQLIQVELRFRPRALKFCSFDRRWSEGLGPVVALDRIGKFTSSVAPRCPDIALELAVCHSGSVVCE